MSAPSAAPAEEPRLDPLATLGDTPALLARLDAALPLAEREGRPLTLLQLERGQLVGLGALLVLLLLFLLLADVLDQLFLFGLDEFLAVGQPGLRALRRHVRELRNQRAGGAVDRHDEQVAVADVGHVRIVAGPARISLVAVGPRQLAPCARDCVNQDDVAAVYSEDAAAGLAREMTDPSPGLASASHARSQPPRLVKRTKP